MIGRKREKYDPFTDLPKGCEREDPRQYIAIENMLEPRPPEGRNMLRRVQSWWAAASRAILRTN